MIHNNFIFPLGGSGYCFKVPKLPQFSLRGGTVLPLGSTYGDLRCSEGLEAAALQTAADSGAAKCRCRHLNLQTQTTVITH